MWGSCKQCKKIKEAREVVQLNECWMSMSAGEGEEEEEHHEVVVEHQERIKYDG